MTNSPTGEPTNEPTNELTGEPANKSANGSSSAHEPASAKALAKPALIQAIEAGSPAAAAGLKAGEYVHSVNGRALLDYIDWRWESDSEAELSLEVSDNTSDNTSDIRKLVLQRDSFARNWGISFADCVFDKIRTCNNDCVFCFMRQLPTAARASLRLRDDDYRLSFLQGNFITLSNLEADDVQRIIEQRVSPLRISFHAFDKALRTKLMGDAQDKSLQNFDRLVEAGIDFHMQIVLLPGVNDGEELEKTLAFLNEPKRKSHILSVGIVPLAYTDYAPTRLKELLTPASSTPVSSSNAERELWAKEVISQVQKHQFREYEETGQTWVYLADEFYIHAHAPFPLPEFYDGFPQLENGIGMVLNFIADVREHFEELQHAVASLPGGQSTSKNPTTTTEATEKETVTIVCGELLAQTWLGVLSAVRAGGKIRLLPAQNRFFGGNVSVTGLLTAQDIVRAIKADHKHLQEENAAKSADENTPRNTDGAKSARHHHRYLVPDCIFNDDGITLDYCTADDIIKELAEGVAAPLRFYKTSVSGLITELATCPKSLL